MGDSIPGTSLRVGEGPPANEMDVIGKLSPMAGNDLNHQPTDHGYNQEATLAERPAGYGTVSGFDGAGQTPFNGVLRYDTDHRKYGDGFNFEVGGLKKIILEPPAVHSADLNDLESFFRSYQVEQVEIKQHMKDKKHVIFKEVDVKSPSNVLWFFKKLEYIEVENGIVGMLKKHPIIFDHLVDDYLSRFRSLWHSGREHDLQTLMSLYTRSLRNDYSHLFDAVDLSDHEVIYVDGTSAPQFPGYKLYELKRVFAGPALEERLQPQIGFSLMDPRVVGIHTWIPIEPGSLFHKHEVYGKDLRGPTDLKFSWMVYYQQSKEDSQSWNPQYPRSTAHIRVPYDKLLDAHIVVRNANKLTEYEFGMIRPGKMIEILPDDGSRMIYYSHDEADGPHVKGYLEALPCMGEKKHLKTEMLVILNDEALQSPAMAKASPNSFEKLGRYLYNLMAKNVSSVMELLSQHKDSSDTFSGHKTLLSGDEAMSCTYGRNLGKVGL